MSPLRWSIGCPTLPDIVEREGFTPEINAVTLVTDDMVAAVAFYGAVGLQLMYGGADSTFTSFRLGQNYLNLSVEEGGTPGSRWGRVILHVASPDEMWRQLVDAGYEPSFEPRNAPWGERYFHVLDPDGHEVSFARRLDELRASPDEREVD